MTSKTYIDNVTVIDADSINAFNDAIYKGVGLSGFATVASATTPDIFATTVSGRINYTGTTTCTGFVAAPAAGVMRVLICGGAAVFTAGANMLIDGVSSGSNLTCAANDIVEVIAVSTTQFRLSRTPYAGTNAPPWPTTTNQIVTANGTVTIPTGATRAKVRMVGSGGGGGGGDSGVSNASGGGAGAYAEQWFAGLTAGNTLTATVPAGGAAGATGANGTAGSQTSLVSGTQTITTLSANGGVSGKVLGTAAGATSTTSGAALTIAGGGSSGTILAVLFGSAGGNSVLGLGGAASNGAGLAGNNYGSGGGGGSSSGANAGGAGAAGVIIIEWYS
jgi:hypothetical protein